MDPGRRRLASSAAAIRTAAESLFGSGTRPTGILLTHIHPDHSGSAGAFARSWEVPVYVHADELPMAAGRYLPQYAMPAGPVAGRPLMRLLPAGTRARIEAANSITDVVQPLPPTGACRGCRTGSGSPPRGTPQAMSPTCVAATGSCSPGTPP